MSSTKPSVSLRPPTPAPAPDDWVTNGPASLKHLDPAAARPRGLHSRRDGSVTRKRSIYLKPATDQKLEAFCAGQGRTASSVIDAAVERYLEEHAPPRKRART